ncbi:hypothetical protein [Vibrio mediterranei]
MKFFLIQNGTHRFVTDNQGFQQMCGEGWYAVDVTVAPCYKSAVRLFADS